MLNIKQLYDQHLRKEVDYGQGTRVLIREKYRKPMIEFESTTNSGEFLNEIPLGRLFFASDHHFGHTNIIKYANRPFTSVEEMNETMIERHNEVVTKDDICVFGGDISFAPGTKANQHLRRMNGYKIFVIGNHDFEKDGSIKKYVVDESHLYWVVEGMLQEFGMVFTHYPIDGLPNDVINFHGHIHEKTYPSAQHINLCVEHWDYAPVSMQQLLPIAHSRFEEMRG